MEIDDPWNNGMLIEVDPPDLCRPPEPLAWFGTDGVGSRRILRLPEAIPDRVFALQSEDMGVDKVVIMPFGRRLILSFGGVGYWFDVADPSSTARVPIFPVLSMAVAKNLMLVALNDFARIAVYDSSGVVWRDTVVSDDLEVLSVGAEGIRIVGTRYGAEVCETLPLFPAVGATMA